jgi:hypothetical protein
MYVQVCVFPFKYVGNKRYWWFFGFVGVGVLVGLSCGWGSLSW